VNYSLFTRPTFLDGAGSVIDLFGVLNNYNYSRNEAEADFNAQYDDFSALYKDFYAAVEAVEQNVK